MDHMLEVSDSTDWQQTSLPAFETVDSFLRCQICKEFFDTALITSCNHSFCSLCIRRCITANGKCPTCQSNEQENRLRKNVTLQEVTDAFVAARTQALQLALVSASREQSEDLDGHSKPRGSKRKRSDAGTDDALAKEQSRRRSQRRKTEPGSQAEVTVIDDDATDEDYKMEDGRIACPICGKRMKEQFINAHLDNDQCGERPSSSSTAAPYRSKSSKKVATKQTGAITPDSPSSLERLPQLNYSLLNERALSKKLAELGIPSLGPKSLLIKRHLEWINIWNANCDSSRPRKRKDLTDMLSRWERTQGGQAPVAPQNSVMRKDFDGTGWAAKHRDDFSDLIASARKKKALPLLTPKPSGQDAYADTDDAGKNETSSSGIKPHSGGGFPSLDLPSKIGPRQANSTEGQGNQDVEASKPPLPSPSTPTSLLPSLDTDAISKPMFEVPKEPVTDAEVSPN